MARKYVQAPTQHACETTVTDRKCCGHILILLKCNNFPKMSDRYVTYLVGWHPGAYCHASAQQPMGSSIREVLVEVGKSRAPRRGEICRLVLASSCSLTPCYSRAWLSVHSRPSISWRFGSQSQALGVCRVTILRQGASFRASGRTAAQQAEWPVACRSA